MHVKCGAVCGAVVFIAEQMRYILKIPKEQTEPTDYIANCSMDSKDVKPQSAYTSKPSN